VKSPLTPNALGVPGASFVFGVAKRVSMMRHGGNGKKTRSEALSPRSRPEMSLLSSSVVFASRALSSCSALALASQEGSSD
jgi:hypothetical protein